VLLFPRLDAVNATCYKAHDKALKAQAQSGSLGKFAEICTHLDVKIGSCSWTMAQDSST